MPRIDPTYVPSPALPSFDPGRGLTSEIVAPLARDGYNRRRWNTYRDYRDTTLRDADAVIDREKSMQDDPDAVLTPGSVPAFAAAHGMEGAAAGPARV